MKKPVAVLALDGPGGAGKGAVGRAVAARLGGWHYLDSGALYRVLALAASRRRLDAADTAAITAVAAALAVELDGGVVRLDGEDAGAAIRTEEVGRYASAIAGAAPVRAALIARQRAMRRPPGLVADGRDMGTVVFPDAQTKVFLTASLEERARRRHKQLKEQGIDANLSILTRELRERDGRDARRATAPLRPAADAVVVDTTAHPLAWVVARVLALVAGGAPVR
ncbi:MAG TPA: (d)CMP kinase [Gammaproteobacteria bacterium]|nr:(d)CMP kinase [Gammaproteobacteria bacterium]